MPELFVCWVLVAPQDIKHIESNRIESNRIESNAVDSHMAATGWLHHDAGDDCCAIVM